MLFSKDQSNKFSINFNEEFNIQSTFLFPDTDILGSQFALPYEFGYEFAKNEENSEIESSLSSHYDHSTQLSQNNSFPISKNQSSPAKASSNEMNNNELVNEIIATSYIPIKKEDNFSEEDSYEKLSVANKLLIRSRRQLRKKEFGLLNIEFEKNPIWDKKLISRLALEVGLPFYKVYKWNWDMKKKHDIPTMKSKKSKAAKAKAARALAKLA